MSVEEFALVYAAGVLTIPLIKYAALPLLKKQLEQLNFKFGKKKKGKKDKEEGDSEGKGKSQRSIVVHVHVHEGEEETKKES